LSPHRFDRDTAVRRLPDGAFEAELDRAWWIVVGPNGGYLAAILLRALIETVGDAERAPRSLTVHYVSPAHEGPVRIATKLERAGRSLSSHGLPTRMRLVSPVASASTSSPTISSIGRK